MRRACLTVCFSVLVAGSAGAQIITTVAGGGPNNMPATAANIYSPLGVAVDATGNTFVSAFNAHRVYRIDATTGVLTVVAGTGLGSGGGDGGAATNAGLDYPSGIALDNAGHLFIADQYNLSVRQVNLTTGIITTVATGLYYPTGVAVDTSGHLFIADSYNHRVLQVERGS
jgi:DNA-binding beta-propeller fold protein YncE